MKEELLSVGIDIGTSSTEVVFSNITVENLAAGARIPEMRIVDKKVIYRSPVYDTPLLSEDMLDAAGISEIINREYAGAGFRPEDVKTGAVIITGETARRENAEEVLGRISGYAGDFVVATAGPHLESVLAGKGSGAEAFSKDRPGLIMNLDIGGGTTNVAVFENGEVIDAGCFDIGGKLVKYNSSQSEPSYVFRKLRQLSPGKLPSRESAAELLARGIMEIICPEKRSDIYDYLMTGQNTGLKEIRPDYILFSGGVGQLIYEDRLPDKNAYNDIGVVLAEKIKEGLAKSPGPKLIKAKETIGATVVGAGMHSMSISGSTIRVTRPGRLPLTNIPIIKCGVLTDDNREVTRRRLGEQIEWLAENGDLPAAALAADVSSISGYDEIKKLAQTIAYVMEPAVKNCGMLIVLIREDMGKALGQAIQMTVGSETDIICLDGISVSSGDYIDIGSPVGTGGALPVVIKTIAFDY